jgi:MSHA pilin protein MshD
MSASRRQRGMTLIELVMFIVIVAVGIAGILSVLNITVLHSADSLVQKQAQALAEGLLEEIQTGYFAYCDGADEKLKYAKTVAECTGGVGDSYGPEANETRPYNTVKDYASAANTSTVLATALPGEAAVAAPAGYTAAVTIGPALLGTITQASGDALLIRVVVTAGSTQATAEGYKTRQVPQ